MEQAGKSVAFRLKNDRFCAIFCLGGGFSDNDTGKTLGILKKLLLHIIVFAAAFCCRGGAFTALEDEDAGQLVYRRRDSSVYVFKKRTGKLWEGVLFRGSARRLLAPEGCLLLDFTEKTLTPEAIAFSLVYWTGCTDGYDEREAFRFLAQRCNAPATDSLISYYGALKKLQLQLDSARREALQAKARSSLSKTRRAVRGEDADDDLSEDKFLLLVEKNPCRTAIEALVRKNSDVFSGTVLFLGYRALVLRMSSRLDGALREQIRKQLGRTEEELLRSFERQRANGRKRENDFRKLCPDRHGRWEYASPGDLQGMRERADSCFRAFRTVWQSSPESEFPAWGNAMLEVLQMVGSPELEKQFDEACGAYRKRMNGSGGN